MSEQQQVLSVRFYGVPPELMIDVLLDRIHAVVDDAMEEFHIKGMDFDMEGQIEGQIKTPTMQCPEPDCDNGILKVGSRRNWTKHASCHGTGLIPLSAPKPERTTK